MDEEFLHFVERADCYPEKAACYLSVLHSPDGSVRTTEQLDAAHVVFEGGRTELSKGVLSAVPGEKTTGKLPLYDCATTIVEADGHDEVILYCTATELVPLQATALAKV